MYVVRNTICSCGNDTYNKSSNEWTCCNCGKKTPRTFRNKKARDIEACSDYEIFIRYCTPSQLKHVEDINSRNYLTFVQGTVLCGSAFVMFKDDLGFLQSFEISIRGKKRSL